MRLMLAAILVAAAAWSAFWWFGARSEAAGIRAWFDARTGANYQSVATRGFPNRFDTTVTGPVLRFGAAAWSAPFVQTLRLSYRSAQYILAIADTQTVDLGPERLSVRTASSRASAVWEGTALDRITLVVDAPTLRADTGWSAAAERLLFATRRHADGGIETGLTIDGLDIGGGGRIRLHAEGVLRGGGQSLSGTLSVTSNDWAALLDFAAARAWITQEEAGRLQSAVAGDRLDLTLRDGATSLGSVMLGILPSFSLR